MLTKVEVRNVAGTLLTLTLDDVTDGLIVEDIEGLGPVKATFSSSSFAQYDGVLYQSSRREARNIIFTIGLEPDYVTTQVRDLRQQLYNFFMTKVPVYLRFFIDDLEVDATGRVETCEPVLFTKEPQISVSIMCFDPDFIALEALEVEGDTVEDTTEFLISYPGTVETGVVFTMTLDRDLDEFTIYHRPPDNVVRSIDFAATLLDDDVIVVNSITGSKAVTLTRASTLSSILYAKAPQSNWLELLPGDNYLRVYAVGAAIPFTMAYTPRYGGL